MAATIYQMEEKYEEYLIDESKYKGHADSISFPESEDEILAILEDTSDDSGGEDRNYGSRCSDGRPYFKSVSYESGNRTFDRSGWNRTDHSRTGD